MAIRIATLVGSLRRDSINRRFAHALVKLAPADLQFDFLEIGDLPPYDQDQDDDQPAPTQRLKQQVRASQAVLFVTPEYNRSVPGVLKNAIDHASRPYGDSAWQGKPAGVVGVSIGSIGTACAQQHLRTILAYLDMPVMGQPEAFIHQTDKLYAADGSFGEASRGFVQAWMDAYAAWVRRHTSA